MQISEEITIQVSPKVAQAYQKATESQKQCLATIVSLFLGQEVSEEVDFLGKLKDIKTQVMTVLCITAHAEVFRPLFGNQCQFRHCQNYLTGLMVLPNKSLAKLIINMDKRRNYNLLY